MELSPHLLKKREELGNKSSDFFFLFHTMKRGYYHHIDRIAKEIGLSNGQPPVLLFLDKNDTRTQSELCSCLHIKPASMTDVLQRMEKNELVMRKRGEKDLRTMHVSITEKGKAKSEEFLKREAGLDELFFQGFSAAEKDTFLQLFARMTENLISDLKCWEDEK